MTNRAPLTGSLGTYRLLDLLSVGGMAEVFRATSHGANGLERVVAVKRILPQFANDAHFMAMFINEAKIAARLEHPNIVRTLDLGMSRGMYFLAMEYIPSLDLRSLLGWCNKAGVQLPIAHTCRIVAEVCDALSYLHNQRDGNKSLELVHRDISPSNVLISATGEVKLIDFGVAKTARARGLTEDGTVKGKVPYLAPERLYGGGDYRADIFGAGVLLWELLCAERLFPGKDDREIVRRIKRGVTPPASTRNHLVPPALDAVLAKALARDAGDRYQDAAEMHDELRAVARTLGEDYSERALVQWIKRRSLGKLLPGERASTVVPRAPTDGEPRGKGRRATTAAGTVQPGRRARTPATAIGRVRRAAGTIPDAELRSPRSDTTIADPPTDTGGRNATIADEPQARVTFRAPTQDRPASPRGTVRRSGAAEGSGKQPQARANEHVMRRMARGTPHLPMPAADSDGAKAPDPNAVELRVYSEPPGAQVIIEMPGRKRELGVTPLCAWLDRGTAYLLTVRHPGHEDWTTRLVFHDGSTCAVSALLSPSENKAEFKDPADQLPGSALSYDPSR